MISLFKVYMDSNISLVTETLNSGMLTQGEKVEEFESALKEYFDYPYILTLNSATSGLILALRMLNLPIGSEVISVPLTCMATTCSILENRLKIKWVDIDKETCNIDFSDLKNKISPQTKAVIIVHWAGTPVDMKKLYEITKDIPVIQDCAHAFGAEFENKKLGTDSRSMAVYSLQAIKHLTCGDGGLIFLPNQELYDRAKKLRWYGISRTEQRKGDSRLEHDIAEWGYKFHMNDINASIGLTNLPKVNWILNKHRENAKFFYSSFSKNNKFKLLTVPDNAVSSFWIFTLLTKYKSSFVSFMHSKKIMVSQVHRRNDIHSCVSEFKEKLQNMDELEKEMICIPVGWWLSFPQLEYIKESVLEWDNKPEIRELNMKDENELKEYCSLLSQMNGYEYKVDTRMDTKVDTNTKIYILFLQDNIILSTVKVYYENKFGDPVAHIEDLVTDRANRNKGYASILLSHVKEEAKSKGCYKIVLNTLEKNINFYKNNNFIPKGIEMELNIKQSLN